MPLLASLSTTTPCCGRTRPDNECELHFTLRATGFYSRSWICVSEKAYSRLLGELRQPENVAIGLPETGS